jgi:magnesium transporter
VSALDQHQRLSEHLARLLEARDASRVLIAVAEHHPADVAAALPELDAPHRVTLFRLVAPEEAGAILTELDDQTLLDLLRELDEGELSRMLGHVAVEDAAEVVGELPAERAEKVLGLMEEARSEDVREALEYPADSAGRLMSPDVVAIPESATVAEAIEHIRHTVHEDQSFQVYTVDEHRHLTGVVPVRRLLVAPPHAMVGTLADHEVVGVSPETDQEEVARLVARYDLPALPVVDRQNRLLGVIRVDDVIDVLHEEASEDLFRLAGSEAAELERRSPGQIALLRLPWIMATIVIELGAGLVISFFDETLSRVILLASFMPVIQAISGNTGLQSATMVVRGLATGHVQLARWREAVWRQLRTTTIIGAACGLLVGAVGAIWHGTLVFGGIVGFSMFVSVNLSGLAGTTIPMLSKRLGFDPAITAGPFETAFQDLIGVSIFLSLATLLLRWLV